MFDGKKFCDQPVDNSIKQYDEVDLSKQKALDPDPRAIQQIVFQGVVGGADNPKIILYAILEQSKETVLEIYKGIAKLL